MTPSWCVHAGFDKKLLLFDQCDTADHGERDGALAAQHCPHKLSLRADTTTSVSWDTRGLSCAPGARDRRGGRRPTSLSALSRVEASHGVRQHFSHNAMSPSCFCQARDWLSRVVSGEVAAARWGPRAAPPTWPQGCLRVTQGGRAQDFPTRPGPRGAPRGPPGGRPLAGGPGAAGAPSSPPPPANSG